MVGFAKALLVAGCLIFGLWCWWLDTRPKGIACYRFVAAAFSLLLLVVLMPGEYTYFWFLGSWLLIACVALAGGYLDWCLRPAGARRWRSLLLFGCWSRCLISARKRSCGHYPRINRLTFNIKMVREEVPVNAGVLTNEYWWALADRNRV